MCRMKKQINVNGSNDLVVKSLDSQSRGPVFKTVSRQLLHEENCPRLGLGFGSRLGLVLGLQGNQTIAEENSPLVRVWVRVGFGGWGQFSSRAIVLEPFKTTGWLQGRLSLSSFRGR